jgi:hypothetical protein
MTGNNEKRKHTRIGNDMPFQYSLSILEFTNLKRVEAFGNMVDMSERGIGFVTEVRLEPGHIIRINREDGSFVTAQVVWTGEIEGKYRVGVLTYK